MPSIARLPTHNANILEVGKSKAYRFQTIQSALDAIEAAGDSAAENPHAVLVAPGVYEESLFLRSSHVSIIGTGPGVMVTKSTVTALDASCVNMAWGEPGDTVARTDQSLLNLTVVNKLTGASGEGEAPEPAVGVGDGAATPDGWDRLQIENCRIIGNHDALQMFGNATTLGKLWVRNNYIACAHDAFTLKCRGHVYSSGNHIFVRDRGPHPDLFGEGHGPPIDLNNWKSSGFHFNQSFDPTTDLLLSVGDTIVMDVTGASRGQQIAQRYAAGILHYPSSLSAPRFRFVSPNIFMRYDDNVQTAPTAIAGVCIGAISAHAIPDGQLVIEGGSIHVEQVSSGGTAPTVVDCVVNMGSHASGSHLRIAGTVLSGSNAAGTCYGLRTTNANATITARCHGIGLSNDASAGGTLAQWTPTP